ncbi:MAG: hypothetical protein Q8L36_03305 [bacterium]|nr:hypothetical protein [bacterium]
MSKGHTHDETAFPGWYVELQANILRQLPRPHQIGLGTVQELNQNQDRLKKLLAEVLLPEPPIEDYLSRVMAVTIPPLPTFNSSDFHSELERHGVRIGHVPTEFSDPGLFGVTKASEEMRLKIFQSRSQLASKRFKFSLASGSHHVSLGQIVWLIQQQPNGEKGFLQTSGLRSVFFVEDLQGLFWMIDIQFHGINRVGHWSVYAYSCYEPFVGTEDLFFSSGF